MSKKAKKMTALILAVVIAVGCAVGGVVAFLTSKTEKKQNTFTIGNIDISISESENLDLQLVPNTTITKDPKITVKAKSVDSYLFVEIEESANLDTFVSYEIASGWLPLGDAYPNVYYRTVSSPSTDMTFSVLKNDQVTIIDVDKATMDGLNADNLPTLSFIGYAIQKAEIADAETGWTLLREQYPAE